MNAPSDAQLIRDGSPLRYVALALWVLLAAVFFSLAWQWIALTSSDKQLTEYTAMVIQRAFLQRRTAADIRALVLVKAEALSIPLAPEQIRFTEEGPSQQTIITYAGEIRLPLLNHVLYRKEFNHSLRRTVGQ